MKETVSKFNFQILKVSSVTSASLKDAGGQIYPGLNANKIQIPYDKHHKVSSLVKSHLNTHNSVKYEVVIKQCLRSILDISSGGGCNSSRKRSMTYIFVKKEKLVEEELLPPQVK